MANKCQSTKHICMKCLLNRKVLSKKSTNQCAQVKKVPQNASSTQSDEAF